MVIFQSIKHPALDAVSQGIKLYFQKQDISLKYLELIMDQETNPESDKLDNITQIKAFEPDLLITLGTQASQNALHELGAVNLVFSAVTDPLGSGLVKDMQEPGGLATGLTDMSPVQKQLEMLTWIQQDISSLGIVFSEFEQNAVTIKKRLQKACTKAGLKLIPAAVKKGEPAAEAAQSIVDKVDALYIPTDNYVVSQIPQLARICASVPIPLYAADPSSVAKGALACLSIDYHSMGLQTGAMALRVLKGHDPSSMPVEKPRQVQITINLRSAQKMDVALPMDLMLAADKIYDCFPGPAAP